MLTIEGAKCRICGTQHAADAATCPVCGAKTQLSAAPAKPAAGKAKPAPFGLDSATLLAKINSLDWEEPTIQPQAAPAATLAPPPSPKRALLLPFLVGFAVLLIGMLALRYFSGNRPSPAPVGETASAAPAPAPAPVPAEPPAASPAILPPPAAEAQPSLAADDLERSKTEEARLKRAELKRKALAAKQALEEQSRLERAEQERLRAERDAAEARARAAAAAAAVPPAPKGPTSPQEVCAGEQNVFAQGACEARTCAMAQWRNHPFCVKRWQDELRKLSPGAEN